MADSSSKAGESSNVPSEDHMDFAFTSLAGIYPKSWFADFGASRHMADEEEMFINFRPVPAGTWPFKGIGKNNKPLEARGIGDILVFCLVGGKWQKGILCEELTKLH